MKNSFLSCQRVMACKQQSTAKCWGRTQRAGAAGKSAAWYSPPPLLNHSGTAHIFQGSSLLCYGFRGPDDRSNYIKEDPRIMEEQNKMILNLWPLLVLWKIINPQMQSWGSTKGCYTEWGLLFMGFIGLTPKRRQQIFWQMGTWLSQSVFRTVKSQKVLVQTKAAHLTELFGFLNLIKERFRGTASWNVCSHCLIVTGFSGWIHLWTMKGFTAAF